MQISASAAQSAYARAMQAATAGDAGSGEGMDTGGVSAGNFGAVLSQAVGGAIGAGHAAEAQAAQGIAGGGDMTQIVASVSQAQLALQTTTVIRDKMVQAYQDIMRMSI